jgi:alkanesulfonate monooxygenase SsuD/methylene tetrahydromethanopterin reductase-like flavin-dependent oxidoreductase (luciferase family)
LAASAEAGIRRAARLGRAWLAEPASRLATLVALGRLYREASGTVPGGQAGAAPPELPVIREVFVDRSRARARQIAGEALMARYATYATWGHERDLGPGDRFGETFDELAAGRFIVGDPAECAELVHETVETLGVTTLFCHSHWPGFPAHEALRSARLFAEEVRPLL